MLRHQTFGFGSDQFTSDPSGVSPALNNEVLKGGADHYLLVVIEAAGAVVAKCC